MLYLSRKWLKNNVKSDWWSQNNILESPRNNCSLRSQRKICFFYGPNGRLSYQRISQIDKSDTFKRWSIWRRVMFCNLFLSHEKSYRVLLKCRLKIRDMVVCQGDTILLESNESDLLSWIYQECNVPYSATFNTTKWFMVDSVRVIEWSSMSPYLNRLKAFVECSLPIHTPESKIFPAPRTFAGDPIDAEEVFKLFSQLFVQMDVQIMRWSHC